jgi:protein-disulfide isomerase
VRTDLNAGSRLGVSSTPAVFINGRLVSGAQPYETFAAIIEEELERAGQSSRPR